MNIQKAYKILAIVIAQDEKHKGRKVNCQCDFCIMYRKIETMLGWSLYDEQKQ